MQEKVYFKNSEGLNLCGILSNPTSNKEKPIIIICHGFSGSKNSRICIMLEKVLCKRKLSTFRFDFFGHGESGGKFEDVTVSEGVDDILSAIKYLKKQRYKKLGLIGISFGGNAGIMAASKTNDIFILALLSPVSDYEEREYGIKSREELEEWKNKGYRYYAGSHGRKLRLNYTFFEDFKKNKGYEAARKIKIPVFIVHGNKDENVSVEQSKKTANLIKNCKIEIIENADHKYTKPEHFEKMLGLVSKFIASAEKIYLKK